MLRTLSWMSCRPCSSNLPVWLRTPCHKRQTGEFDAGGTDIIQEESGMGSQPLQGKLGTHLKEMTVVLGIKWYGPSLIGNGTEQRHWGRMDGKWMDDQMD